MTRREVYLKKLNWVIDNVDLRNTDPYNPKHISELIRRMFDAGILSRHSNSCMIPTATANLVRTAKKQRGIK